MDDLKILCLLTVICFCSCHHYHVQRDFDKDRIPAPPNYAEEQHWHALPWTKDYADRLPSPDLKDAQAEAEVDVFFVHPTIYWGRPKKGSDWNASLSAKGLNRAIEKTTIKHQASLFNAAGKVYAPKYRQAHLHAYYTKDKAAAEAAFEVAYQDVRTAFYHYLEHYNEGRPFILASHSQGTTHCARLLIEEFDTNEALRKQMIAAYVVGIPIPADSLKNIPVCTDPEQTNCFVGWCCYKEGFYPKNHETYLKGKTCVNPLTWTCDVEPAGTELNEGGVFRDYKKLRPGFADARVHDGMIWISKVDHPLQFLNPSRNFHAGDFNLYWLNVRKNAVARVQAYLSKN